MDVSDGVTPFAGVWIEIVKQTMESFGFLSLPSRECGLKSVFKAITVPSPSHSLRGSVD